MSEPTNWIPISIFTFSAGLQVGAAVYDGWKRYVDRREETDYEKVQNGAVIRGWKTAVSRDRIETKHNLAFPCCALPPWPNFADSVSPIAHDLSLLMRFIHRTPDDRWLYVLRRYSLIADIDSTILRLVIGGGWWYELTCYLTGRLIAVLFRSKVNVNQFRVVFVDTILKTTRISTIQSPLIDADDVRVIRLFLSKNGLTVVFSTLILPENDDGIEIKRVFCNAIYEMPAAGASPGLEPVNASSVEDVVVPARNGNVHIWSRPWGVPLIALMYNELEPDAIDRHLVVSYDRAGDWRVTTFADWWTSFRDSSIGWRFLSAVDAFASLSPPLSTIWCNVPQLEHIGSTHGERVCGTENGTSAYFTTCTDGTLQRWIAPPSLKRQAAAAVFKALPGLKPSQLKSMVGFDVFDGTVDSDEEKTPIVNL